MSNFKKSFKPFDTLETGTYRCTLHSIKEKPMDVMDWSTRPPTKTGRTQRGYNFCFKVDGKNAFINKKVAMTSHEKGGLFKLLCELYDWTNSERYSLFTFHELGYLQSEESEFYGHVKPLEGMAFEVKVRVKDGWNNFVSGKPIGNIKEQVAKNQSKLFDAEMNQLEAFANGEEVKPLEQYETAFDDGDDLPF
jgi:hypothetical protein